MNKKKNEPRPSGYVHLVGSVWYLTHSVPALAEDGRIINRRKKDRIGSKNEYPNLASARARADEMLEARKHSAQPDMTLRAYVMGAYSQQHLAKIKLSSQHHYWTILNNHILPACGEMRLIDITSDYLETLLQLKLKTKSVQTCLHIKNCISSIYTNANKKKLFGKTEYYNPAKGIELPANVPKARHALTLEQAGQVVRALAERNITMSVLALLSLCTSLTRAEMLGLSFEAVNLTPESQIFMGANLPPYCLSVARNWYLGRFSTVKVVGTRERLVPLPMVVVQALQRIKDATQWNQPDDCVFCSATRGVPARSRNLELRVLKPVGRALGMPWLSWHVFRHSYATIADQLDFTISDRLAAMGHAGGNVNMLMRYTSRQLNERRVGAEDMAARILAAPE
jgi:integrase